MSIHFFHRSLVLLSAGVLAVGLTACDRAQTRATATEAPTGTTGTSSSAPLAGHIVVDGSSTVLPISRAMATAFHTTHAAVEVSVQSSGTGGGFRKFCAGETDITGASRPINQAEIQDCDSHHVEFIELPMAFDSLTVVVNAGNNAVQCLTVAELKTLWDPSAEGRITRWKQVRSSLPDRPIALFGPGKDSGTFDYFTLAIVGTQSRSRTDYTSSEDDTVLVNGIEGNPDALGYFGYAYYAANRARLKAVAIDSGHGCVAPGPDTVADNSYQPLSRPMFIYVKRSAADRPEVRAFAEYFISPEHSTYASTLGYMPLSAATLLSVARRLDHNSTGSVFGGRGSVIGVSVESFQDEDKIQSALVR